MSDEEKFIHGKPPTACRRFSSLFLIVLFLALELVEIDLFHVLFGGLDHEEHDDGDREHSGNGEEHNGSDVVPQPIDLAGRDVDGVADVDRLIGRCLGVREVGVDEKKFNDVVPALLGRERAGCGAGVPVVVVIRSAPSVFIFLGDVGIKLADLGETILIIVVGEILFRVLDELVVGKLTDALFELGLVEIVERVLTGTAAVCHDVETRDGVRRTAVADALRFHVFDNGARIVDFDRKIGNFFDIPDVARGEGGEPEVVIALVEIHLHRIARGVCSHDAELIRAGFLDLEAEIVVAKACLGRGG